MKMRPELFLSFNGQCEAAFEFYARTLGGTVGALFRWGNSPMAAQAPEGWAEKVLHGSVSFGGGTIAGADVAMYQTLQGFSILLNVDTPEDAQRAFDALGENATVVISLQQTFWSARYGKLVDQFGVPWEINCQQEPPS
jgi:PhnB protein